MNKTQNNSITLIGPASVGKSLISKELSKLTGMPVISLDMIINYITKPINHTSIKAKDVKQLKKLVNEEVKNTFPYKKGSPEHKKQKELIENYITIFENYFDMFGYHFGFQELSKIFQDVSSLPIFNPSNEDYIAIRQICDIKMLEFIFSKFHGSAIFDVPATFAYKIQTDDTNSNCLINLNLLDELTKDILSEMGTIVYLEPGEDFEHRQTSTTPAATMLYQTRENYYQNADVVVSTNGIFPDAYKDSETFKHRFNFDAATIIKKEKLLNKAEIANICEQILSSCKNLNLNQPEF